MQRLRYSFIHEASVASAPAYVAVAVAACIAAAIAIAAAVAAAAAAAAAGELCKAPYPSLVEANRKVIELFAIPRPQFPYFILGTPPAASCATS